MWLFQLNLFFFESGDSTNAGSCKGQEKVNEENTYDQLEFNRPVKELVPHYQSSKTLKSIASIENGLEGKNKKHDIWLSFFVFQILDMLIYVFTVNCLIW